MDLRLFAQRKCHGDIRYEKLTFPVQVRPQQVVRTSVCSAAARRSDCERCWGNYRPSRGEALLEYLWWILEWELTLRLFFFFRYLMHKRYNSDCYLSPLQRYLSPLSHTISSPLILTLNCECRAAAAPSKLHAENGHLHDLKAPMESN